MSISASLPDQINAHQLLVAVGAGRTTATYESRQDIYRQGEIAESIFFVQQGIVDLSLNEAGVDLLLGKATEGQFFGASCLDGVAVRITSARAVIQSRITSVTKAAIISIIRERPKFAKMFTDHLWYHDAPNNEAIRRLLKLASERQADA